MTNPLTNANPATLAILGKMVAAAAKATRDDLVVGTHEVAEELTLDIQGTLNVGEGYEQNIVAKAKPWDLLTAAIELANKQLAAAGVAGIDMEKVITAAEQIDPKAVKTAKKDADTEVARRKAPTLTQCKGKVTVAKGATVEVVEEPVETEALNLAVVA